MEYLHIIPAKAGAVLEFLRCLEKTENLKAHKVLCLSPRVNAIKFVPEMLAFPFIEYMPASGGRLATWKNERRLRKRLERADVLIWHTLPMSGQFFLPVLYWNPELCRRSVWIEDGADVESWAAPSNKRRKNKIDKMNRAVRRMIPIVGIPFEADRAYIARLWPEKKIFLTPYPLKAEYADRLAAIGEARQPRQFAITDKWIAENEERLFFPWLEVLTEQTSEAGYVSDPKRETLEDPERSCYPEADEDDGVPHIQIGLNSQAFNKHINSINALRGYCAAPIKCFLPMNYILEKLALDQGGKVYRDNVSKACEGFEDRFTVLNANVSSEQFFAYLSRLDAAVLGNSCSVVIQYLLMLLKAGVKTYLPAQSVVFSYLKEIGAPVFALETVGSISLSDLVTMEKAPLPPCLDVYFDPDAVMDLWKKLFRACQGGRAR